MPRRVIVVGAGPSGLEAARVARLRGHEVTLWEARPKPGGRWAYLISGLIKERLQGLCDLGISISLGQDVTIERLLAAQPEVALVTPALVPRRGPFSARNATLGSFPVVLTADELLDQGIATPKSVAVLGSGSAGCEAAQALLKCGAQVTMVDFTGQPGEGIEPGHRVVLIDDMIRDGLEIIPASSVSASNGGLIVSRHDGGDTELVVGAVILALGYDHDDSLLDKLRKAGIDARPLPAAEVPQAAIPGLEKGGAIAREI